LIYTKIKIRTYLLVSIMNYISKIIVIIKCLFTFFKWKIFPKYKIETEKVFSFILESSLKRVYEKDKTSN